MIDHNIDLDAIVRAKLASVKIAIQLCEEHTSRFLTPEEQFLLIRSEQVVKYIEQNFTNANTKPNDIEIIANILSNIFDKAQGLCAEAVEAKSVSHTELRKLYEEEVLGDKRVDTIFYNSPNRIQLEYKKAKIYQRSRNCKANPGNIIEDDWTPYFQRYVDCIENIDKVNCHARNRAAHRDPRCGLPRRPSQALIRWRFI